MSGILVIRGGAIGDFVLTLPAIGLMREAFPETRIEILGYKHIVAMAEGRHYADSVRSIEYGPMAAFFSPLSDLAPDLTEYFASFSQVVSYLYDPDGFFERNLRKAGVRNYLPAHIRIDDSEHAARQLARPLQSLALYLEDHAAHLHPSHDDHASAADFLGDVASKELIAIHPGSGSPKKNWAARNWAITGKQLTAEEPGCRLLLVGGEADHSQLDELAGLLAECDIQIARDLPLPVLAAILARCRMFLGHDSGISHIAAAVDTPSFLLFGPTDPEIWAPANESVAVITAPGGDLSQLDSAAVLEALRSFRLQARAAPKCSARRRS